MKIELKKIKVSESQSEETTAFTADIYIDGKNAGYAKNDGHGGCTLIGSYESKGRELLESAEAYCATLPSKVIKGLKGLFKVDLESLVDDLLYEHLNAKEAARIAKRLPKDMIKGVCYKTDGGYVVQNFKGYTLIQLMTIPNGVAAVIKLIKRFKSEGKEILNTNLTPEILVAI